MIWIYIILGYWSLFALGISDNIRGPLFPEILNHFVITDTQGSIFFAISSFCGFIASYSLRFLLGKIPRLQALQLSMLLMGIGLLLMGFAQNFVMLLVGSSFLGTAMGAVGVVQNVLVTVGSTAERRRQMLSGLHSVYGISSLLAPLVVAGMGMLVGSWRASFLVVAAVPFLVLLYSLFSKDPSGSRAPAAIEKHTAHGWREHAAQLYSALAAGLYVMAEIMMSSRLALYMRREFSWDLEQSSLYLTLFFLFLLLGRLLFTFVSFKQNLRFLLSAALLGAAVSMGLGLQVHPFFLVLSGFFLAPFYPLMMAYTHQHFEKNVDSAVSYVMAMQSILIVVMHTAIGYLTDRWGIHQALWVGPCVLVLAFFVLNSFETLFRKKA